MDLEGLEPGKTITLDVEGFFEIGTPSYDSGFHILAKTHGISPNMLLEWLLETWKKTKPI